MTDQSTRIVNLQRQVDVYKQANQELRFDLAAAQMRVGELEDRAISAELSLRRIRHALAQLNVQDVLSALEERVARA